MLPGRYKATVSLLAGPGPAYPAAPGRAAGAAYSELVTRLRIALAQANSTVGDLAGNAAAVLDWTRRAADAGADLVVFPEMMLTGYPVEDLALRASFVTASIAALADTARAAGRRRARRYRRGHRVPGPPGGRGRPGRRCRPARRWTRPRCCTAAGSW